MPTRKALRRQVARELKHTGLPLPIRGSIAKLIVRGDDYRTREVLLAQGCTLVRSYGCECCDPSANQEWSYRGRIFFTEYGRLERRANPPKAPTPKKPKPPQAPTPAPIDPDALTRLEAMRKEHVDLVVLASCKEAEIRDLASKLVRERLGEKCPSWLVHDSWNRCVKSPTLQCVFDHTEDNAHLRCLFCGNPEERK